MLSWPAHLLAQADNGWVGKRVVQKYERFRLKLENQVVDTKRRLETYRVEHALRRCKDALETH
jgi:hypothetical protein